MKQNRQLGGGGRGGRELERQQEKFGNVIPVTAVLTGEMPTETASLIENANARVLRERGSTETATHRCKCLRPEPIFAAIEVEENQSEAAAAALFPILLADEVSTTKEAPDRETDTAPEGGRFAFAPAKAFGTGVLKETREVLVERSRKVVTEQQRLNSSVPSGDLRAMEVCECHRVEEHAVDKTEFLGVKTEAVPIRETEEAEVRATLHATLELN